MLLHGNSWSAEMALQSWMSKMDEDVTGHEMSACFSPMWDVRGGFSRQRGLRRRRMCI